MLMCRPGFPWERSMPVSSELAERSTRALLPNNSGSLSFHINFLISKLSLLPAVPNILREVVRMKVPDGYVQFATGTFNPWGLELCSLVQVMRTTWKRSMECLASLRGAFGRGVTLLCRAMTIQTLSGRRRSRTEFYLESHGSTGESGDLITCGWKVPTE